MLPGVWLARTLADVAWCLAVFNLHICVYFVQFISHYRCIILLYLYVVVALVGPRQWHCCLGLGPICFVAGRRKGQFESGLVWYC